MSRICDLCGKGKMGNKSGIHRHSGKWHRKGPKSNREWGVNLRTVSLDTGTKTEKLRICTSCLKGTKVVAS